MATNMNIRPYYDDFSEDKNYYRILFRPSFSVQARELTQLQTILSDQVSKVGNSLLDDGDVLSGGEMSYDSVAKTVTVKDGIYYLNGVAINVVTQGPIVVGDDQLVGFLVVEEFVNAGSDDTLYDNAAGSPNYRGPGADRFKIGLELVVRDEIVEDEIFIEIFRLISGKVYQSQTTASTIITEEKYSEKIKHSDGDYVLDAFDIDVKDYSTYYSISVNDGVAVIDGKDVKVDTAISTNVNKARDPLTVDSITANIDTGNYTYILKSAVNLTIDSSGNKIVMPFGSVMDLLEYNPSANGLAPIGVATPTHIASYDETYVKLYLKDIDYISNKSSSDVTHLAVKGNIIGAIGLHSLGSDVTETTAMTDASIQGYSGFSWLGTDSKLFRLSAGSVTSMSNLRFEGKRVIQKQRNTNNSVSPAFAMGTKVIQIEASEGDGNFVDLDSICLITEYNNEKAAVTSDDLTITTEGNVIKLGTKDDTKEFNVSEQDAVICYSVLYSTMSTASKIISTGNASINGAGWTGIDPLVTEIKLGENDVISFTAKQYKNFNTDWDDYIAGDDWTDVTDEWMLESTESDSSYGLSYIKLRPNSALPTGVVYITYAYWSRGGGDQIFHGGTYSDNFDKLESRVDSDGTSYNLADVLDLRDDNKLFYNCKFTGTGTVNGKRTDSLIIKSDGSLSTVTGIKHTSQADKNYIEDGIKLYDLNLNPYDGIDFVRTHGVRNVNYIHNLGERISSLEEQIVLNPLESQALTTDVGYKVIEGVLVDGFRGVDKTVSNQVSVDYIENELRPNYSVTKGSIVYPDPDPLPNGYTTPKVVTLGIDSSVSDIANLQSDGSILINEAKKSVSYISLDPITWKDETQALSIMSDPSNYFNGIDHTTVWNEWQHFWYGGMDDSVYSSSISVDNKGKRLLGNNYKPYVSGTISGTIFPDPGTTDAWSIEMDGVPITTSTGASISVDIPTSTLSGKKLIKVSNGNFEATNYLYARGYGQIGQEKSLNGLVQEFTVLTDTFYTKVDLYFDTVDSQDPVFVQIKDMSTGDVIPYSTKMVSSISVIGQQTFTFDETILLKPGKYGLVVATSSETAKLTTGKYGSAPIGPLNGDRFSTLKFNLHRAEFNLSSTDIEKILNVSSISNPIDKIFVNSDYPNQVRVYQPNHSFTTTESVNLSGFSGNPVQEISFSEAHSDTIETWITEDTNNNIYGLRVFQQIADTPVAHVDTYPNINTLIDTVNTGGSPFNYGTVIGWKKSEGKLKVEMNSGIFSMADYQNQALMVSIVFKLANGQWSAMHILPSSVSDILSETSIMGVSTDFLNDDVFTVISYDSESYVLETNSDTTFIPAVSDFYTDSNIQVDDADIRADMLYLNSSKYLPVGTTEQWNLIQGGISIAELSPNANTYLQKSKEINSPSIKWKINTTDSRVSPVLYTDSTELLIISNLIDSKTSTFADKNINWVEIDTIFPVIVNGQLGEYNGVNPIKGLKGIEAGDYLFLEAGDSDAVVVVTGISESATHTAQAPDYVADVSGANNIEGTADNKLYKLVGYVSETHLTNGTSLSKYITNEISFDNSINGVRVDFDAICPAGNWIEVYFSDGISNYTEMPRLYPKSGLSAKYESFCYQANMEYINSLQVKIVFKGENTLDVPTIKNLKVLGLSDYSVTVPSTTTEVITVIDYGDSSGFSLTSSTDSLTITGGAGENVVVYMADYVHSGSGNYSYSVSQGAYTTSTLSANQLTITQDAGAQSSDVVTVHITDITEGSTSHVMFTISLEPAGSQFTSVGATSITIPYNSPHTEPLLQYFNGHTTPITYIIYDGSGQYNHLDAGIDGDDLLVTGINESTSDVLYISATDATNQNVPLQINVTIQAGSS